MDAEAVSPTLAAANRWWGEAHHPIDRDLDSDHLTECRHGAATRGSQAERDGTRESHGTPEKVPKVGQSCQGRDTVGVLGLPGPGFEPGRRRLKSFWVR